MVEVSQISRSMEVFGPSGLVLSTEQKTSLLTSLVTLKASENFHNVTFWGKIMGNRREYFIAQGFPDTDPTKKKSFYSLDCLVWAQLPVLHPLIFKSALRITSQFTGNLSNEYVVRENGPGPSDVVVELPADVAALRKEEAKEDGSKIIATTITEDKRLAAVIRAIDSEVGIVPRGAYRKAVTGAIEKCRTFEGLSSADAAKLSSYLHFRPPLTSHTNTYAEEALRDAALDFLDPICEDVPKTSWSLQFENGSEFAILRSLVWLGSVAYNSPGRNEYAQVYCGTGIRNNDLAFML